jgi:hypothetical protein
MRRNRTFTITKGSFGNRGAGFGRTPYARSMQTTDGPQDFEHVWLRGTNAPGSVERLLDGATTDFEGRVIEWEDLSSAQHSYTDLEA